MAEKEWSENPEDDPIELQKKQLALGQEFMDRLKKQEAEEKLRQEKYAAMEAAHGFVAPTYTPPPFEEVSARLKRARDEVDRIMLAAEPQIKLMAFEILFRSASGGPV